MALGETLTDFFWVSGGFAENATIGAATVPVIFDNAAADPLGIVAGTRPEALAVEADVASIAVGDTVTIRSVAYTVAEILPDGTGLTRLMLKAP
jgi:hypothetical protein